MPNVQVRGKSRKKKVQQQETRKLSAPCKLAASDFLYALAAYWRVRVQRVGIRASAPRSVESVWRRWDDAVPSGNMGRYTLRTPTFPVHGEVERAWGRVAN